MTKLLECPSCTRHVRVDDGRCPFCGRPSTTSAPARVLALVLPLTLMACSGAESPPAGKPPQPAEGKTIKPIEAKVVEPPPEPTPVEPAAEGGAVVPPQPSEPADDGDVADEPVEPPGERIQATKYGGPPVMDVPMPEPEARPARKYGAPPKPEPRPAKKYGAPPRPGSDPLG